MLTKKDLAKRWGVSYRTVNRWLKRDKHVPFHKNKVNKRIYFEEREVQKWEELMGIGKVD